MFVSVWLNKRQHTTSTERSQKFRDKKKQEATQGNNAQHNATESNAAKQPKTQKQEKTEQIREDTEQSRTDTDESRADSYSDVNPDPNSKKDSKQKRAREEKEESEKEKQKTGENVLDQMLQIWNTEVQEKLTKGHKAVLTAKRKQQIKARWVEDFKEDIRAWQYYCEVISASDFCMGRIKGKNWTIDLGWAVESSEHVVKILEGGFSGGKHPVPMPPCYDPQLQTGWDHVLACFTNKYGKAVCKSWLSATLVFGAELTEGGGAVVTIICQTSFIHEWITKHYLQDLNLWWAKHSYQSHKIIGIQLKIKEVDK